MTMQTAIGTALPGTSTPPDARILMGAEVLPGSEEQVRRILDSITDAFIVVDPQWRITFLNRRAEELAAPLGKTRMSVLGRNLWEEFDDLAGTRFESEYRRAMTQQETVELEEFFAPLASWFAVRAYPSPDGLSLFFQDVTRRKQAELRLAAERAILDMITADERLERILERIAIEAEKQSVDGMLCSILLLDDAGTRLLHGAAPSLSRQYNDAIHGIAIGPSVGSCGTAAHTRRAVWVEDIQSDPLWADYRALAAAHGLAACCSTPVFGGDERLLGTIAMYYRKPWRPRASDEAAIQHAARLASIAIERTRQREALARNAERLRATFDQAGVGIASSDESGRFVEMNPKFCEIVGYTPAELKALTFWELTDPADLPMTRSHVAELVAGRSAQYAIDKRYRRKDGVSVWCRVTTTRTRDDSGRFRFIRLVEDITQRRATEGALRRSEQFSRSVIESSRDCIKTLSLDGKLTWISERGQHALCIDDVSKIVGHSWIDFWDGEYRERARAAVQAAAAGGTGSFVGPYAVQQCERWWDVVVSPIRDAQGRPESLLAVSRDITERFEAEARLKESALQLQQLANAIPQLAWMAEPDGNIFWFNEGWYRYTGRTPEEMQGWGWKSVHDPGMLPAVIERWEHSLRTGEPFEMEFPLRGGDGVSRWFLTRVNPLRDAQGQVFRWFGTNTDVDNVRRVRQALEEETRVLELLNRTGQALGSTLDVDGLVQTITDAATEVSGAQFGAFFYNVVDERGEAFRLYTLSGLPRSAFRFEQPRATALFGPTFRGESVIRCDDVTRDPRYGHTPPHHGMPKGHPVVRSYLAVPVISRAGEVLGGLFFGHAEAAVFTARSERLVAGIAAQAAVAIDNARLYRGAQTAAEERKLLLESERHARAAAERAAQMKDEFLATLSHELRTPLSAILGWTQVLKAKPGSPEEVRKRVEAIERNARVQKQLIEDLLDMSRIASGKLRLELQPLDPVLAVDAAVETVRHSAEAKGVQLVTHVPAGVGSVRADAARLQQVVWNLLVNAIKFTPAQGSVSVELRAAAAAVEIVVADTGQGIDPEFLGHVFERFRQADASITRRHGGLGLGLAIVRNLVDLHGGTVCVRSDGQGKGATFIVTLPTTTEVAAPPAAAAAGGSGDFRVADLAGLSVLVVDDQIDARELISRVLAECHAQVSCASNAADALELVRRERPQVLVSDIGMPEVDGFQLLKQVRALGATGAAVRAIALTAFARPQDRERVLAAGFEHHVSKPLEPAELIRAVAALMRRPGDDGPRHDLAQVTR
jgi:PAS domain S-box-containing protein